MTNERAAFDMECPDFEKDVFLAEKKREKVLRAQVEPEAESGGISIWGIVAGVILIIRIILTFVD